MPFARPLLALALVTAAASATAQGPGGGQMPPTPVEAVKPRIDAVSESVVVVGTLRAAESVVVRPELAGRIEKVHFEEGQRVTAGAPLFTLDASLVRAEVREWEANVQQSKREADRAQELIARNLVAQSDLDTKRSELAVNEARLSSAKTRLGKSVITAPFAGVTGLRMVSAGEYVEIGTELVKLVQLDPIKIDFRVPEVYLGRLAAGQRLDVVLDAFPAAKFEGKVNAVDASIDPNARNVALRGEIANPEGALKPGLFARVTLELGRRENAMLVPEQALWPQGAKQFVYVIDAGKAALSEVTTGLRKNGEVELLSGVTPESLVVTAGQLKIGPGMPVAPIGAKPAAAAAARNGAEAKPADAQQAD